MPWLGSSWNSSRSGMGSLGSRSSAGPYPKSEEAGSVTASSGSLPDCSGLGVPMEKCCYLPINWVVTDTRILLSWHIVLFILRSLDNKKLFTLGRREVGLCRFKMAKKTKNGSVSLRDIKLPAGKQRFQNISLRKKPQHFTSVSNFKNIKEWFFDSFFYAGFMLSYAILWYSGWSDFESQDVWCQEYIFILDKSLGPLRVSGHSRWVCCMV